MKKYIIRTAVIRGDRTLCFEAEEDEDLRARARELLDKDSRCRNDWLEAEVLEKIAKNEYNTVATVKASKERLPSNRTKKLARARLLEINHDIHLLKEALNILNQAKSKPLREYAQNFDLAILDNIISYSKGYLNSLCVKKTQVDEFYTTQTGKPSINLSRIFLTQFYLERNGYELFLEDQKEETTIAK